MSLATVSSLPRLRRAAAQPPLRLVPDGSEARGFALYVGSTRRRPAPPASTSPALVEALAP